MKKSSLLLISALVCAVSVIFAVVVLFVTSNAANPNFTPPPFDGNAVTGTPVLDSDSGYGEADATAYKVGVCGKIATDNNNAFIYLNNLPENNVWIKARIFDTNGEIIGESGLIKQGEYLPYVTLSRVPEDNKLTVKVMAYEPDTYHSAGAVTLDAVIKEDQQ
ncbi:MAG: hypothetical protein K6F76_00470 [Clostridiales bacterium]|nr:hypothetical protein [Clostridiales bacterium]